MKTKTCKTLKKLRKFMYSLGEEFTKDQIITIQKTKKGYIIIYWEN